MTTGQSKSERPPIKVPSEKKQLPQQLEEFRRALEEEIETIEKNGLSSTLLRKGTQIKNDGASRWYEFAVDYMPVMPADTPCKLIVGKNNYEVSVISATEHAIILASSIPLPPAIEQARLENGATVLMERLIKRIEDNSEKANSAASRLLDYPDPSQKALFETIYPVKINDLILNDHNNEAQTRAVISALTNDATYIWGPPGTGKTSVIAQIIHNLYRNERSVLLISHTNTAVDGAIAKVDKEYGYCYQKISPYPLLRLGKAFQELPERLGLEAHIEELGKDLYARKSVIEQRELQDKHKLSEIETLLSKNDWLNKNRLQEASNLMERMERLEAELLPAQERLSEAEMLYQREMEAHPEYDQQYQALSHHVETERQHAKECEEKLRYSLDTLATLPERLRYAEREVSMHQKREDLEKQKAQSLTAGVLEKHIQTHQYDLAQLEEQEKNNRSEYHALQQSVLEYERKRNIAKLFANKSKIEQARERIVVLEQRYNDICAQKINKQKALDEYQKQLSTLFEINRQLSVLHITNTKDYWINVVSNLQAIEESIRLDLPQLDDDYQYAQQKFHQALEKLDRLKTVHELIESKLQILKTRREEIAVIQKQLNDCYAPYIAIVEQEINETNRWLSPAFESDKHSPIYEQFAKIFDLEQLIVPCVDSKQQKCPLCAGTMLAAESSDGGFYWTCDQCDYSRNPMQPYPTDGVLRCAKCQSSFVFDMKKQPRWVCAADSKHYQAIRAGDLKLPKMLQLIPTKRYAEVNAYFKEKTGKPIAALEDQTPKPKRRPLLQLDDNNVVIKEYAYLADAIRETGLNSKSIRDAATGVQKHAGGYRWKYKDDV